MRESEGDRLAGVPRDVITAFGRARIPVLLLSWPRREGQDPSMNPFSDEVHLLVPPGRAAAAKAALEDMPWRLELGSRGLWRFLRKNSYGFGNGVSIHLHWGVPAGPLPSRSVAHLERALWAQGTTAPDDLPQPEKAARLLFLAVQAVRPGFPINKREWERQVADLVASIDDASEVWSLASACGVEGTLRRALASCAVRLDDPRHGDGRDGARDLFWAASSWFLEHLRPARLRPRLAALLEGTPMLSRATARCRFGGIELLAGRGVFMPMAISEPMVGAALETLDGRDGATVVEAGTGCGAVSLAIASKHHGVEVHAAELMPKALKWAYVNRRRLGASGVHLYEGSLLEPLPSSLEGRVDVVIANLPYVRQERAKMGRDALGAVVGEGDDGLGLQRRLVRQAPRFLRPGGRLVLQLAVEQWPGFSKELFSLGYRPGEIVTETATDMVVWVERADEEAAGDSLGSTFAP